MSDVVDRRLVSNALRDRLASQITWITGVEVATRTLPPPCVIVDPLQGGTVQRMLGTTESASAGTLPYQLTCVGVDGTAGREQAEHLATEAVAALVGFTDDLIVLVQVDAWGNVRPDHDQQPPVWIAQPMVRVTART